MNGSNVLGHVTTSVLVIQSLLQTHKSIPKGDLNPIELTGKTLKHQCHNTHLYPNLKFNILRGF